jgi:hypothetical protein
MNHLYLIFLIFFCPSVQYLRKNKASSNRFLQQVFYPMKNSGRNVYNFNNNWYFHKGDLKNGSTVNFDKTQWILVQLPHNPYLLSDYASGGINYQVIIWYRKFLKFQLL